jgi:hypothetical protein
VTPYYDHQILFSAAIAQLTVELFNSGFRERQFFIAANTDWAIFMTTFPAPAKLTAG